MCVFTCMRVCVCKCDRDHVFARYLMCARKSPRTQTHTHTHKHTHTHTRTHTHISCITTAWTLDRPGEEQAPEHLCLVSLPFYVCIYVYIVLFYACMYESQQWQLGCVWVCACTHTHTHTNTRTHLSETRTLSLFHTQPLSLSCRVHKR
jgi:hypothetical protein